MSTIDVPSPGDPILDTWGESVANAINDHAYSPIPYAYPIAFDPNATGASVLALASTAANAGVVGAPIWLPGRMVLNSISFFQAATSGARSFEAGLFRDPGSPAFTLVPGTFVSGSFTPSGYDIRHGALASPVELGPGLYWLMFRNTHASNTLDIWIKYPASYTEKHAMHLHTGVAGITSLNGTIDVSGLTTHTSGLLSARLCGEIAGTSGEF